MRRINRKRSALSPTSGRFLSLNHISRFYLLSATILILAPSVIRAARSGTRFSDFSRVRQLRVRDPYNLTPLPDIDQTIPNNRFADPESSRAIRRKSLSPIRGRASMRRKSIGDDSRGPNLKKRNSDRSLENFVQSSNSRQAKLPQSAYVRFQWHRPRGSNNWGTWTYPRPEVPILVDNRDIPRYPNLASPSYKLYGDYDYLSGYGDYGSYEDYYGDYADYGDYGLDYYSDYGSYY